jgi:hypothetical protein
MSTSDFFFGVCYSHVAKTNGGCTNNSEDDVICMCSRLTRTDCGFFGQILLDRDDDPRSTKASLWGEKQ